MTIKLLRNTFFIFIAPIYFNSCTYTTSSIHMIDQDCRTLNNASDKMESKLHLEKVKAADSLEISVRKKGKNNFYLYRKVLEPIGHDSTKLTLSSSSYDEGISSFINESALKRVNLIKKYSLMHFSL
jgi:hypothetical protein